MGRTFSIDSLALHELIIAPSFADLLPAGQQNYNGMLQEMTLMDDVSSKRTIVDLKRVRNILQRRDASCDLVYKKVMNATTRQISVDELYAATNHCKHEFYQGCLKDWRAKDPVFEDKILPYFQEAFRLDIASNSYFGDISRKNSATATWSTNKYDGILKWIRAYYASGVIPSNQGMSMPLLNMRMNPQQAYNALMALVDQQNVMMRSFPAAEKVIYCDQALLDGYHKFLKSIGTAIEYQLQYANGVKLDSIDGIIIKPISIFEPIMTELYGVNYSIAILTLDGNFVFATDKKYGEGEDDKTALMIWYEKKELSWYYQTFLKAGTQIALPEHVVFAVPNL